jgi:NAD(P)-dependent dehydrogenase (short-subunit alcohol dehydrogenase family)
MFSSPERAIVVQPEDILQTAPCLRDLQGKVAIVTGASAGIGKACAVALAVAGMKVVACARREEKLEEFKSAAIFRGAKEESLLTAQCDVQNEGDIKAVIASIEVRSLLLRSTVFCVNVTRTVLPRFCMQAIMPIHVKVHHNLSDILIDPALY